MAALERNEPQNFSQPWKFSDVVLVVEDKKLHVHRAVLALCSPVFEKMFTSEFQEKGKNEISLPGKKAKEIIQLLQVVYPSVSKKPTDQIKEGNCRFLLRLADEYQMDAIVERCEDYIVTLLKRSKEGMVEELVFAETYNLQKLKKASIELAGTLNLRELKQDKSYDKINKENLQEILEAIIVRLEKELRSIKSAQVLREVLSRQRSESPEREMVGRGRFADDGAWN